MIRERNRSFDSARGRRIAAFGGILAMLAAGLAGCGPSSPQPRSEGMVRRGPGVTNAPVLSAAAIWLWEQQTADGGWHSHTYAQLRTGQALTPLVLHALQRVPPEVVQVPPDRVARALHFIRESVNTAGTVGLADRELPEYPNYATALAVQCLLAAGNPDDRPLVDRMCGYLAAEQFRADNGFGPEHVAHGGWGFGGPRPSGGTPGHIDLAHTRHVLSALRRSERADKATVERAQVFLRLLQRDPSDVRPQPSQAGRPRPAGWRAPYDGGFYFTPVVLAANKASEAIHEGQPYFRSYATATCEGVLALLASGVDRHDQRVVAAERWLEAHPRLDRPDGIPPGGTENWAAAIRFYHLAVRAECYAALDWPGDWQTDVARLLATWQASDGHFRSEAFLMKEDDPLLATTLAVLALCPK